jgi:hypothetical protein
MIRFVVFFLVLSLPNLTLAEINYFQLKTLLKICETAQHSSDHGTIKNIASQLKDAERPSDEILAKKYDECLLVAFGKSNKTNNVTDLLNQINESALKLERDCDSLLNLAPTVAVTNLICKEILLR